MAFPGGAFGAARIPNNSSAAPRDWSRMTRTIAHYQRLEQIGEGTYGQVYRATCLDTGRVVALKKIRVHHGGFWGMPPTVIREIKILKRLRHPRLVEMIEVVSSKGVEHLEDEEETAEEKQNKRNSKNDRIVDAREGYKGNLYLVLEYVSHDLTGLMDVAYRFSEVQVKCIFRQLLEALAYMHDNKYVHRDIKSSNILIDSHFRVKLADFGLARCIEPPILDSFHDRGTTLELTNKVITLWYRPPEILLGATRYGPPVDVWSAGCILAELMLGRPLFTGKTEMEQLQLIFDLMGTPTQESWEGLTELKLLRTGEVTIGRQRAAKLRERYGQKMPGAALNLLEKLLELDPQKRLTANRALTSRYFLSEPRAPEYPEQLGILQLGEGGGHFHEFQTKKKRREAKAVAKKASDEFLSRGMSEREAEAEFDAVYRDCMKKVAAEGNSALVTQEDKKEKDATPKMEEKKERGDSQREKSDRREEKTETSERKDARGDKGDRERKEDRREKSDRSERKRNRDSLEKESRRGTKDDEERKRKRRRDDEREDRRREKERRHSSSNDHKAESHEQTEVEKENGEQSSNNHEIEPATISKQASDPPTVEIHPVKMESDPESIINQANDPIANTNQVNDLVTITNQADAPMATKDETIDASTKLQDPIIAKEEESQQHKDGNGLGDREADAVATEKPDLKSRDRDGSKRSRDRRSSRDRDEARDRHHKSSRRDRDSSRRGERRHRSEKDRHKSRKSSRDSGGDRERQVDRPPTREGDGDRNRGDRNMPGRDVGGGQQRGDGPGRRDWHGPPWEGPERGDHRRGERNGPPLGDWSPPTEFYRGGPPPLRGPPKAFPSHRNERDRPHPGGHGPPDSFGPNGPPLNTGGTHPLMFRDVKDQRRDQDRPPRNHKDRHQSGQPPEGPTPMNAGGHGSHQRRDQDRPPRDHKDRHQTGPPPEGQAPMNTGGHGPQSLMSREFKDQRRDQDRPSRDHKDRHQSGPPPEGPNPMNTGGSQPPMFREFKDQRRDQDRPHRDHKDRHQSGPPPEGQTAGGHGPQSMKFREFKDQRREQDRPPRDHKDRHQSGPPPGGPTAMNAGGHGGPQSLMFREFKDPRREVDRPPRDHKDRHQSKR